MSSYEDYDWDNPQENYRYERDQAIRMVPGADPNELMFALEMAWMRGHHAGTELGWAEEGNVFRRPPADVTEFTPEYKAKIWPKRHKVDTEEEKD